MTTLNRAQVADAGLDDWVFVLGALEAQWRTGGFAAGLAFVDAIGAVADEVNHHPDLTLTWPSVAVRLTSHDSGGVTSRDVELARTISGIAKASGLEAARDRLHRIELALDTADAAAIAPFWAAVLGYDLRDGEAIDPQGRSVNLWFQQSEPHPVAAQRFHVDVYVAPELAQARIDAALAAGGTLVSDAEAPSFVVLADPDGNKVCVCT